MVVYKKNSLMEDACNDPHQPNHQTLQPYGTDAYKQKQIMLIDFSSAKFLVKDVDVIMSPPSPHRQGWET